MKSSPILAAVMTASMLAAPVAQAAEQSKTDAQRAAEAEEIKRLGSLYLRCDGQPNNVTGAESFARLMGAITLLGLFAPRPEAPDPSKRLFGEKGVDACSQLIDDPKGETNGLRRIPLILGRAAHRIEARQYAEAITDVDKARGEAKALGLVGNPYFDRSMGLSFDALESAALLRMGKAEEAQAVAVRGLGDVHYSLIPLVFASDYGDYLHGLSPAAERVLADRGRIDPAMNLIYVFRLEGAGRFTDAAIQREASIALIERFKPETIGSLAYAAAAATHALAGEWDRAAERAKFARENIDARAAAGTPDENLAATSELLDFYDVLRLAHEGAMREARLRFAARSRWTAPSFGMVSEANRRLREGAKPDELFGALAQTPEQMWQERHDERMAALLKSDADNRTLFLKILPYAKVDEYEGQSKTVWLVDKHKMSLAKPSEKTGFQSIYSMAPPLVRMDAVLLDAALLARQAGKQGFIVGPVFRVGATMTSVLFLDAAEAGGNSGQWIEADAVIAELGKVIPSPEALKARKAAQR